MYAVHIPLTQLSVSLVYTTGLLNDTLNNTSPKRLTLMCKTASHGPRYAPLGTLARPSTPWSVRKAESPKTAFSSM